MSGRARQSTRIGASSAVDEVLEEIERLVVREVEIVEDEDDGAAAARRLGAPSSRPASSAARAPSPSGSCRGAPAGRERVGLEEALDDGAPEQPHLLRVAAHRLDQRRVEELELEELAEEVADVADLAILEDGRDLRADLRLRGLAVHALDDAEARAEHAREDVVGGALIARRAAEDARRAVLARALLREEIADEARLADAVGADERDGAGAAVVADGSAATRRARAARPCGRRGRRAGRSFRSPAGAKLTRSVMAGCELVA